MMRWGKRECCNELAYSIGNPMQNKCTWKKLLRGVWPSNMRIRPPPLNFETGEN